MKPFHLYESPLKNKRFRVYFEYQGRIHHVDFGAIGSTTYPEHKDDRIKMNYLKRHAHDHLDDPLKAGFWSLFVNWNLKNRQESFRYACKLAKSILYG